MDFDDGGELNALLDALHDEPGACEAREHELCAGGECDCRCHSLRAEFGDEVGLSLQDEWEQLADHHARRRIASWSLDY